VTTSLDRALAELRGRLLDDGTLVSAVAAGHRRGERPSWRRVELRYVDLKAGRRLQVTAYDATQAHTANHPVGDAARAAVDALLDEPFGNWHLTSTTGVLQMRVTKKLDAVVHAREHAEPVAPRRGHDRDKQRLLPEADPVLVTLGISTREGEVKPSRRAKYRQVEEFLRLLDATLGEALEKGHLRHPTAADPLRVVDLGCGNAYLTFAAHRYLTEVRGLPVAMTGVDTKEQSRRHNEQVAAELGIAASFVTAGIADVSLDPPPEVVLALHACDTATDDALLLAIRRNADHVAVVPCCQAEVARQLADSKAPAELLAPLFDHPWHRREFGSHLTNVLRALALEASGYKVTVTELTGWEHAVKNELILGKKVRAGSRDARTRLDALAAAAGVRPRILRGLDGEA
jgi:SAM-dependent methyltransferase